MISFFLNGCIFIWKILKKCRLQSFLLWIVYWWTKFKNIENNVFYITCLGFYFIIKKRKYKHHFKLSIYFDHYQITKYRQHDSRSLFILRLKETELGFCFFLEPSQIKGTFPIQIHIHLYFFRTFQKILKVLQQQITSNSYM